MDLYYYNDPESAISVLALYGLMGIFGVLFLSGRRYGLLGLMILSGFLLIAELVYVAMFLTQTSNGSGWHDPSANCVTTIADSLFSLLILVFSFKVYKET